MLGGVGKNYAKVLVSRLIETDVEKECVLISPDTVDRGSICKFTDDSEEGAKWIKKVAEFQAEAPSEISEKQNALTDTMEKPANAEWTGAMARCEASGCTVGDLFGEDAPSMQEPGAHPWLVCSTSFFVEVGPNVWALLGLGFWVNHEAETWWSSSSGRRPSLTRDWQPWGTSPSSSRPAAVASCWTVTAGCCWTSGGLTALLGCRQGTSLPSRMSGARTTRTSHIWHSFGAS